MWVLQNEKLKKGIRDKNVGKSRYGLLNSFFLKSNLVDLGKIPISHGLYSRKLNLFINLIRIK